MFLSLPRYPNNSGPGPRPRSFSSLMILKCAKQRELQLTKEGIVIIHFASSFQHRPLHHSALCNIESLPVLPHHPTTDCSPQPTWLDKSFSLWKQRVQVTPRVFLVRSWLAGMSIRYAACGRLPLHSRSSRSSRKHLDQDGGVLHAQHGGSGRLVAALA